MDEATMGSFIIPDIAVSGIDVFGSGSITLVNGAGTFSTTGFNFRNLTTAGVDGLGVSPN